MPRIAVDYTPWKDFITRCVLDEKQALPQVRDRLKQEQGVEISLRTLQRTIANWSVSPQPKCRDTEELRARVTDMFHHQRLTDSAMVRLLKAEGFQISNRGLSMLRRRMGLHKRIQLSEEVIARTGVHYVEPRPPLGQDQSLSSLLAAVPTRDEDSVEIESPLEQYVYPQDGQPGITLDPRLSTSVAYSSQVIQDFNHYNAWPI